MEVIEAPEETKTLLGLPRSIRVDQGAQPTSKALDLRVYAKDVVLEFSRPGKLTDNTFAESFNAVVRLECLSQRWFLDLDDARQKVENWRREYNEVKPHIAIGDMVPMSLIHLPEPKIPS